MITMGGAAPPLPFALFPTRTHPRRPFSQKAKYAAPFPIQGFRCLFARTRIRGSLRGGGTAKNEQGYAILI